MNMMLRAVHGQLVRSKAERDRYFKDGVWVAATLYGNEEAARICQRDGITIKALGEATNPAGGFLVREEMEESILAYQNAFGVFRRDATVKPMGSDVRSFPRRLSGPTA